MVIYNSIIDFVTGSDVAHVTPLFYAVQQNHKECVNLLIDKTDTNNNDNMIWDLASKRGNTSLTSLTEQDSESY